MLFEVKCKKIDAVDAMTSKTGKTNRNNVLKVKQRTNTVPPNVRLTF